VAEGQGSISTEQCEENRGLDGGAGFLKGQGKR
jgi:hypothetical protein